MSRYRGNAEFRHDTPPTLGVLLSNLGTPDAPTPRAVRRYLAEFLWDPRVVEVPRPLWWLILNGVILRTRPSRSARAYAKVWTDEGSPLLVNTLRQRDSLARTLSARIGDTVHVEVGMRYGKPSLADAIDKLEALNCTKLVLLPLYPQFSATTTASTFDEVSKRLAGQRNLPALHFVNTYHDDPAYIEALAASVREHWSTTGRKNRLLMSFHGIPQRYRLSGDPYPCYCHKTSRLLAARLGLADGEWAIAFQSRLGREEWLRPYTDEILAEWARDGLQDVDVVCPGFSSDCLETLEEVGIQYRELFVESGGNSLSYIPALNDRDDHIDCLAKLIEPGLRVWLSGGALETPPELTLAEAKRMGARQ